MHCAADCRTVHPRLPSGDGYSPFLQALGATRVLASGVLLLLRGRGNGGPGLLLFNWAEFAGGDCSRPSS
jgi:hypothetical protein